MQKIAKGCFIIKQWVKSSEFWAVICYQLIKDLIFIYGFLGGLDGGGGGEDVDAELLQVLHLLLDHLLDEGVQIDRERQEDLDRQIVQLER